MGNKIRTRILLGRGDGIHMILHVPSSNIQRATVFLTRGCFCSYFSWISYPWFSSETMSNINLEIQPKGKLLSPRLEWRTPSITLLSDRVKGSWCVGSKGPSREGLVVTTNLYWPHDNWLQPIHNQIWHKNRESFRWDRHNVNPWI